MFHQMITNKRDKWLASPECTVKDLLNYIEATGQMRDAQVEAIKTYLFLKIVCGNKPLWELFSSGAFNSLDLDDYELKPAVIKLFNEDPAALALFEYSTLKNDKGEQTSEKLEKRIRSNEENINYTQVIKDFFYGVSYSDYVFSLPMGAGKTYLMAAFIYLDLFFAQAEPNNHAFAHNFIIFAPSGLKSSVIPSLRTIEHFDPSWIIPEPAASNLKKIVKFEVLDQQKSAKKSNKAKNPNVQKIAAHQPFDELMGLILVTNAEKVILDYLKIEDGQLSFLENDNGLQANELRKVISQIPRLSIFIDEVHHVAAEDIKLRAVVNDWNRESHWGNANVIGFSGTPYLDSADPVTIGSLSIKNIELSNVVFYYPLTRGIGNFLKRPLVYTSDNPNSMEIVAKGVREFLDLYKDTVYTGELTAKLAIYCGQIIPLEETFLPLVNEILAEYGLNPNVVLKYYGKDSSGKYTCPPENAVEFAALDSPVSKKKIILLAQIGKEGWDCRSLTGVILSQKGDCPTNMVLQTSCRCLRQVEKGKIETAGIWLNEFNAATLEAQLQKQQHISIREFTAAPTAVETPIERFDRRKYLRLPSVDFYQLRVQYSSLIVDEPRDTTAEILASTEGLTSTTITKVKDFNGNLHDIRPDEVGMGEPVTYNQWLYLICKESFDDITIPMLSDYDKALKIIFERITLIDGEIRRYLVNCDHVTVRSRIRVALSEKTSLHTKEDTVSQEATLLHIENFISPVFTTKPEEFYPAPPEVKKIIDADSGKIELDPKKQAAIEALRAIGNEAYAQKIIDENTPLPEREKTYHYLPYHFDSDFERRFFIELVAISAFKDKGLEVYYNGDRTLTDFKIRCYKGGKGNWRYIGKYTPDFLIIRRRDGQIFKAIIVETKGEGYAEKKDFKDKRLFMETVFKDLNKEKFGYERFDYLYLEDSLSDNERINKTVVAINEFFEED